MPTASRRGPNAATLPHGLGILAVAPIVPCRTRVLDATGARVKRRDGPVHEVVPLLGVGAAAGFLAGLFGVGGGAVVEPFSRFSRRRGRLDDDAEPTRTSSRVPFPLLDVQENRARLAAPVVSCCSRVALDTAAVRSAPLSRRKRT